MTVQSRSWCGCCSRSVGAGVPGVPAAASGTVCAAVSDCQLRGGTQLRTSPWCATRDVGRRAAASGCRAEVKLPSGVPAAASRTVWAAVSDCRLRGGGADADFAVVRDS